VQGFYKKAELELLIQRRQTRTALAEAKINEAIVERYYQTRAIRRIGEALDRDRDRKTLIVMATGAGKTRTVIALCDLLMRRNWVKRVLFLADRVALVNQAVNAFKTHLPDAAPVNLVTEKDAEGRVYVSTYPTMMGLIDDTRDGQRRFGVGHFDLVVIDEAHRSVFQKYGAIFDYFDSLLVGFYSEGELRYAGQVRAGFAKRSREAVMKRLRMRSVVCPFVDLPHHLPYARPHPFDQRIVATEMSAFRWLPPSEVIEVTFLGWGRHGLLRDARFLGVRDDKMPHAVEREAVYSSVLQSKEDS
jgi:hypothetical protein